ncbi:MAG: BlaI/MecI/CopY family transcriptional regulator [Clostridia bacterium]|nr:BlaI/MecI/CopY family transcriptional regulator [Clostridia bacterium]
MKNKIAKIPDTELEIMQVIWNNPTPITTSEVKRLLEEERPWSIGALQTLLNRLIDRGVLEGGMLGKSKTYIPLISEEEYLVAESRSFLRKITGNSITKLVASLYDSQSISDKDLEELKKFIDSKGKND